MRLFNELDKIRRRPKLFECNTTPQFWNNLHISKSMLDAHLNPNEDDSTGMAIVARKAT